MGLPSEKMREIREKMLKASTEAREHLNAITDATPEADRLVSERAHDAAMAEFDRLDATFKREERLNEAEARANPADPRRPNGEDRSIEDKPVDAELARRDAYKAYLRYGLENLNPEERKLVGPQRRLDTAEGRAQGVVDSTAGGYLVPQGFMDELIVATKAYGPMLDPGVTREIATNSGNLIPWPGMDDTANQGRRLTENTVVNTTQVSFNVHQLFAYKYTTDVVLVASELLQDSGVDPEQIIRDAMAVRLGRVVNSDLTLGTGASMPTGIEFAATEGYQAASQTAIGFDDLIELEHSLDPSYRVLPGVKMMFHDLTLKSLRKLKDGEGQYIWQPASVIAKAPATILGHDYVINQAMPQIGAGNKSVVFGDFQRYVVRRVKEFLVRRLNERYADLDQVGFIGFGRYDGALIDQKAMVALEH